MAFLVLALLCFQPLFGQDEQNQYRGIVESKRWAVSVPRTLPRRKMTTDENRRILSSTGPKGHHVDARLWRGSQTPKTYVPARLRKGAYTTDKEERIRELLVFVESTFNLATVSCNTDMTYPACRKEQHRRRQVEAHQSHRKLFCSCLQEAASRAFRINIVERCFLLNG